MNLKEFLAVLLITLAVLPVSIQQPKIETPHGFRNVIGFINDNLDFFTDQVKILSNVDSRFTGYKGFYDAAKHIEQTFTSFGIETTLEEFEITVPLTNNSWVATYDGLNVTAYPIYPNLVNPCPYTSDKEDILVYVGKGEPEDYNGKNISGKFVLMDFASGWNYYYALMLGAKGVIFVPESDNLVIRPESDLKLIPLPLYFPRLYVPLDDKGRQLLAKAKAAGPEGIKVKVKSEMIWKNVKVANVVGFIKGKTHPDKVVVISAYYDAFSVVPALAPGATDALGAAMLLLLAKFFSQNQPPYSVMLVALAGHYQGLWGAREFVERHFDEIENKIIAFVAMDLASESKGVGLFATGGAYSYRYTDILLRRYTWLVSRVFNVWLPEMRLVLGINFGAEFVDAILGSHPPYIASAPPWEPYRYGFFSSSAAYPGYIGFLRRLYGCFDSEPFTLAAYGGGFAFRTVNAFRTYQHTPYDTFDKINWENMRDQIYFIACSLWGLLNEEINMPLTKSRIREDWGYVTLIVNVTTYNFLTGYWDLVNVSRIPEMKDKMFLYITQGSIGFVQKVPENGTVKAYGFKPYVGGAVEAFIVEEGKITWSTDVGTWTAPGGKWFSPTAHPYVKMISIFECASAFVLPALSPTDYLGLGVASVNDARGHVPMLRLNALQTDIFAMVFVQPNVPFEIMLSVGRGLPRAVLVNASMDRPEGSGYKLKKGEQIVLTMFDIVKDMYNIVAYRYKVLKDKSVIIPQNEMYFNIVQRYRTEMITSMKENKNSKALSSAYFTWSALIYCYNAVMDSTYQVLASLITLTPIVLLAVILLDRLLFSSYGGSVRMLALTVIISLSGAALYFLHPAYTLATNWIVATLATLLAGISFTLLFISVYNMQLVLKQARRTLIGTYEVESSLTGILAESITYSLEYMKKRSVRATLAMLTIGVITFALLVFASATTAPVLLPMGVNATAQASFEGLLVRVSPWSPLNIFSVEMFRSYVGKANTTVRAYIYPPPQLQTIAAPAGGMLYFPLSPKPRTYVYSLMAITPEDAEILNITRYMIRGRFFEKDDLYAVILPQSVAYNLTLELGEKVDVNTSITFLGLKLKVIGIIDDSFDMLTNPDLERITPFDMTSPLASPFHIRARFIVLIPYALFQELMAPPSVASVAIPVSKTGKAVVEELQRTLPLMTPYPVYTYLDRVPHVFTSRNWVVTIGYEFLIIPALIGVTIIIDVMLAAVHERRRELFTLTALGITPSQLRLMVFTEMLTYVVLPIFFGVISSMLVTRVLISQGMYPEGLYPNFMSISVMMVIALVLLTAILGAIYPSRVAGRIAVPSLVTRWLQAEKGPSGNIWRLSYPVVTTSLAETKAFLKYVAAYAQLTAGFESSFTADKVAIEEATSEEEQKVRLSMSCRFAPYDMGITGDIVIEAVKKRGSPTFTYQLTITRREGYYTTWRASAMRAADALRRLIISWRGLSPSERLKYFEGTIPGGSA
jgi:ABC-type antimicrobial peptide transport system permease subunit